MLNHRASLVGIAILALAGAACTSNTSLGQNSSGSGGVLGGAGGATSAFGAGGVTGSGGLGAGGKAGAGGIGSGGGGGKASGGTGAGGVAGGASSAAGATGKGGATVSDGGGLPEGGVCCNALYCPSGYSLVGPAGSGSCPTGYECSEFTSCGCNLVLCARLPDGGLGTGGSGTGGRTGGGGAGGMSGGGGANGGTGGTLALDAKQDGPVVCGNTTCAAGEYCCNPACGLCAPVGYGCVQGCGPDASLDLNENDGRPSVDDALAAFCSGDVPKAVVNGIASTPTVTGGILAYDCCDGGVFSVVTQSFGYTIQVMWQAQAGAASAYPATVDLANPSKGWGARVELSCAGGTSCYPPPDSYTSGLEGVLQVSRSNNGFDMSVCLHLAESPASPHPLLHSLDFYATHVTTN